MLSLHRQCHFWISGVFVGAWLVARANDELTIKYFDRLHKQHASCENGNANKQGKKLAASARLQLGVCR